MERVVWFSLPSISSREGCSKSRFEDDCPDGVNVCGQDILGAREARVARRSLSSTRKVDPERGTHTAPFGWVSCDPTFSALCVVGRRGRSSLCHKCIPSGGGQPIARYKREASCESVCERGTDFLSSAAILPLFFFLVFFQDPTALPRPFLARYAQFNPFNRRVSRRCELKLVIDRLGSCLHDSPRNCLRQGRPCAS